jgi:hypothetical protein
VIVETNRSNSLPATKVAQRSNDSAPSNAVVGPEALRWIRLTAFIGILYFTGIGVGYLTFAGTLPELHLRYFLAGVFIATLALRAFTITAYKVWPTRLSWWMYGLFGLIVVIQALWFGPIANAGGLEIYQGTIGDTIVASGILAVTGEALAILWLSGQTGATLWRVGLGLAVCVLIILMGVQLGWNATAEIRLMFKSETGDMLYNYLALGDSLALLGLIMLGLLKRPTFRLATFFIVAVSLFFAYSRTSFFLFLLAAPLVLFIGSRNAQRIGVAVVLAIVVAIIVGVASESESLGPAIERMTVLLFEREADESYLSRQTILAEGIRNLQENWIVGRFLDEWWQNGLAGSYMHNWLSFWQAYGVIPFLGSIALFVATGLMLWKQLLKPTPLTGTAIALWTFAILAIVTSRAYGWPFLWLALGFVTALSQSGSRPNRKRLPAAATS